MTKKFLLLLVLTFFTDLAPADMVSFSYGADSSQSRNTFLGYVRDIDDENELGLSVGLFNDLAENSSKRIRSGSFSMFYSSEVFDETFVTGLFDRWGNNTDLRTTKLSLDLSQNLGRFQYIVGFEINNIEYLLRESGEVEQTKSRAVQLGSSYLFWNRLETSIGFAFYRYDYDFSNKEQLLRLSDNALTLMAGFPKWSSEVGVRYLFDSFWIGLSVLRERLLLEQSEFQNTGSITYSQLLGDDWVLELEIGRSDTDGENITNFSSLGASCFF